MFTTTTKRASDGHVIPLTVSDALDTVHAFTTRQGGVSGAPWDTLNLAERVGDDPQNVRENFRRLQEALNVSRMVLCHQVHGATVHAVGVEDAHTLFESKSLQGDGLVTDVPGLALVIRVADCIPILYYDPVRKAVGAAHAGWRGTVRDIAGETVRRLESVYGSRPENIRAAIGPGIGFCCFETGPEVPEAVRAQLAGDAEAFIRPSANDGKFFVDLKGVNRALLLRAGVLPEHIDVSGECTACLPEKYWSHRVTGGVRGGQAAVVALKECAP